MPPIRTMPIAKPIRTERTHEENQERFVPSLPYLNAPAHLPTEPTLLHRDEATEVWKRASNPLDEHPRSTRSAPVDHYASEKRM